MLLVIALPHAAADALRVPAGAGGCVDGEPCSAVAVVPTFPVGVGRVELGEPSRLGADLAPGVGVAFALIRGEYRAEWGRRGQRYVVAGPAVVYAGLAVQEGWHPLPSGGVQEGVVLSGLVGSRFVALTLGRDATNAVTFIGLALNLTGTAVAPGAGLVLGARR